MGEEREFEEYPGEKYGNRGTPIYHSTYQPYFVRFTPEIRHAAIRVASEIKVRTEFDAIVRKSYGA